MKSEDKRQEILNVSKGELIGHRHFEAFGDLIFLSLILTIFTSFYPLRKGFILYINILIDNSFFDYFGLRKITPFA